MGLWKDIRKEGQQMKQDCKLVLGNWGRIRFWEDKWDGENPLCNLFPTLYAITALKGKMIGKCGNLQGVKVVEFEVLQTVQ